jgi:N-acetylmuramoyl-L-alanine amidase
MNKPVEIIIHHSATELGKTCQFNAIKKYHIETNGWRDIAYHYLIDKHNVKYVLHTGRAESTSGAHTEGRNGCSIGICLVGSYDKKEPEKEAIDMLAKLCADICKRYKISPDSIVAHHKYASYKTCPGTAFPMDRLRNMVKELLKK